MIAGFSDKWLKGIEESIPGYTIKDEPSDMNRPVSKNWFFTQFKAEGLTFEIGDNTPRDLIRLKGQIAAQKMMEILLNP